MVKVSIVILNWNQPDFTIDCVKSVLKQNYKDFEVLVVDNASTDDSVTRLKSAFLRLKKVRLLVNKKNEGYAGGNNFGVKKAKGEYIVILNNDTIVLQNWLKGLVETLESDKNIGAVSSLEFLHGKKPDMNIFTTATATVLGYPGQSKNVKYDGDFINSFGIRGVSFIFRKKDIGLPFESDYFIYGEDIYLGWLLNLKGYRNKTNLKSIVHHFHNTVKKSSKKMNKYFVFLGERNRLINYFRFWEVKNIIKLFPLLLINIIFLNLSEPRKIPYRFKSYWWLLTNVTTLRAKRKKTQSVRKVSDDIILSRMSGKLVDTRMLENKVLKFILFLVNSFFLLWCFVFRIKTIEFQD